MRMSKLYMPAVTLAGALALAGCGGGSGTTTTTAACPAGQERVGGVCTPATDDSAAQLAAVSTASTALTTALAALSPEPTAAEVTAANSAITALDTAIKAADDVDAADLARYSTQLTDARGVVATYDAIVKAEATRQNNAANAAKVAMARALYVAIGDRDASEARALLWADISDEDKNRMTITLEGKPFDEQYVPPASPTAGGAYSLGDYDSPTAGQLNDDNAKSGSFGTAGVAANYKQHNLNESFAGTYHGVDGTYSCTSADGCASGVETVSGTTATSTVLTGDWTFKPTNENDKVKDEVARYGWWLDRTGGIVSDVELIHAPIPRAGLAQSTMINEHIGSATYKGHALGQYAFSDDSGNHGSFKADASLTANFNADDPSTTGSVETHTAISGKIDGFKVGASGDSEPWVVTLRTSGALADGDSSSTGTIVYRRATGVTTRDAEFPFQGSTVWDMNGAESGGQPDLNSTRGGWGADLYTQGTPTTAFPKVVLGAFDAKHDHAIMTGAFGAESQHNK